MRKIIISLVFLYQKIISPSLKNLLGVSSVCRFSPTCSEYTKVSVLKYGVIKGGKMAIFRLLRCHQ